MPSWTVVNIGTETTPGEYTVRISVADASVKDGKPVTVDSAAGVNANKVGLTSYNGTSGGGPPVGVGIAPGSTMSMRFQNVDSRYEAPVVGGLVDNFGMEAYIQPQTIADARPFYNGGDGTPLDALTDGFGLTISGGHYVATLGGVGTIPTGVAVVPGKPVEMAVAVIVGFKDGKISHEHIYWDQAGVLVQVGLLDPTGLPVTGAESARKVLDPKLPPRRM